ncbi:radical SAM protein [Paenibacillus sp. HJGM_3]|uniref:SPL family radical SAM protein n=1 Tax=Paenibacillus sp. HJGM_3 TaxID=3379816 RepID=UPI00385A6FEF
MATVRSVVPKQMLNPAGGYLTGYSHTLNPYAGCSFACSYCYVRRMPVALFRQEEWGTWVDVKEQAAMQLRRDLAKAKRKGPVTIFMSSATDPYQPEEAKAGVTRSLLEAMRDDPPEFLFVQTRSPLVTRDAELFAAFGERIRVSVTIETDRDDVRRAFSPSAPPIAARLKALRELREAGIPTQAAVSPVLPSTEAFADALAAVTGRVCVDDFFMGDGSGGKRTQALGIRGIFERLNRESWYGRDAYATVLERMRDRFGDSQVFVSQAGFLP